ncbi:CidA/LrgA family holin-like protein [Paenibacillus sp. WLX1005]|uniref:CidA/LrgA family holin-like protein n=1 Tax=Paenibacillus sp. WLX1005 TaxID=3243766 RepID=UPI00398400C3
MKLFKIIIQIALLYAFAWLGGMIQQWLHLSIPGSILGLLLLFVLLLCRVIPVSWIETGSNTLLFYLPLFFVPATVGVVNHLDLFVGKGLLLVAVVIVSTALTIVIAGHVSQWLAMRMEQKTATVITEVSETTKETEWSRNDSGERVMNLTMDKHTSDDNIADQRNPFNHAEDQSNPLHPTSKQKANIPARKSSSSGGSTGTAVYREKGDRL